MCIIVLCVNVMFGVLYGVNVSVLVMVIYWGVYWCCVVIGCIWCNLFTFILCV